MIINLNALITFFTHISNMEYNGNVHYIDIEGNNVYIICAYLMYYVFYSPLNVFIILLIFFFCLHMYI